MGKKTIVNQSTSDQRETRRPQTHRVVVVSANTRPKSFVWRIIHEDKPDQPIKVSERSFNSMESAYADGAAELTQYR
jgi:hypothetical protein